MSFTRRPPVWCPLLTALLFLLAACGSQPDGDPASSPEPATPQNNLPFTPVISGNLPPTVVVPSSVTSPEQARPFFDQFSWQSFLAMVWPSNSEPRGQPIDPDDAQTLKSPPEGSAPVFSSYKEAFELFGQGDQTPTVWASYDVPVSPCSNSAYAFGNKTMVMASKSGTLLDEVNEAFSFPLIDQQVNYAHSEVRFNEVQYTFIRDNAYYLVQNLAAAQPIVMPIDNLGSLMVKVTWRIMTPNDDQSRYYTTQALLLNPDNNECEPARVGLVGMHIVRKIDKFAEWIWSSFEQVDNIERGRGSTAATPISFNNGTSSPPTPSGWANRPPLVPPLLPANQRTATQVTRVNPIPATPAGASTLDVNNAYQDLLVGTVWEFYQCIITQWPTEGQQSKFLIKEDGGVYPADCGQPFPVDGCTNVAMETYLQTAADAAGTVGGANGNSCMGCHYGAGQSDFSWVLQNRAH